ncbi:hypothetical protein F4808DRAFT_423749 [Astrocystis sublimbata]|nr:hypothetical protein F4808DRAFT_423749 [Astrocystis sublimbata]
MFRSSQSLCRQALARPIGRSWLHENTRPRQLRRPRQFTTSRIRLAEPSNPPTSTASTPEPSPQPLKPTRRRGLVYAALFLSLGVIGGTFARMAIAPPTLPAKDSVTDKYLQKAIQAQGAALSIVQQLSSDPSWESWDAYSGISTSPSVEHPRGLSWAQSRITSGPMAGSNGLAYQRVFHNASTGEVVVVVYFGAGLAGWPSVVHGGTLATVLDESLGRCALQKFPGRTGVTANLDLQYRAPTLTNNFYIIRTRPVASEDDDVVGADGIRKGDRKLWVEGTLETEKGKIAVDAKALFVVPRGYQLQSLADGF